ncbi:hypothetical protein N7495_002184, partial [Penicillium taxi]|uniref:uncharacterized protein n=1 Tax=Penicillium taxi TaxID=168475 RepID=UPI002545510C
FGIYDIYYPHDFLIVLRITNPNIRSVKLLGSWDNFSKPYPMDPDRRIGPGHWRGCHTITDIMGDGSTGQTQWRTGGLKMGATYWYYYLLNDDMEYCNPAEVISSKCPLLPGQPVNVLNVPIILPDSSHGRSNSNSSQNMDYRTMNPDDKFMNPRKPPKPSPTRLQTSESSAHQRSATALNISPVHAMMHRSVSQPNSATYRNKKSKEARSVSPHGPQEPAIEDRNFPGIFLNPSVGSPPVALTNNLNSSTIQSRRALTANGGTGAQPRSVLTVVTRPQLGRSSSNVAAASADLSTVDETCVMKDTLSLPKSADLPTPTWTDFNGKRLPTLPNTPSSVMDEAVRAIDETDKAMSEEILRSHFSSLTVDESIHSRLIQGSRFSEWSTDDTDDEDGLNSPGSMVFKYTSISNQVNQSPAVDYWKTPDLDSANDAATNTEPNTPHLTAHSKPSSPNSATGDIPPWTAVSLPKLTVSLSSPGLGIEQMDEVESNPKRHAALFSALESMTALSLSEPRDGSPVVLSDPDRGDSDTYSYRGHSRHSEASFRGQATMQELIDELSYLENMIHVEMDGEPF